MKLFFQVPDGKINSCCDFTHVDPIKVVFFRHLFLERAQGHILSMSLQTHPQRDKIHLNHWECQSLFPPTSTDGAPVGVYFLAKRQAKKNSFEGTFNFRK